MPRLLSELTTAERMQAAHAKNEEALTAFMKAYPTYRKINNRREMVPRRFELSDGYQICTLFVAGIWAVIGLVAAGPAGLLGGAAGYLLLDIPRQIRRCRLVKQLEFETERNQRKAWAIK